MLSSDVELRPFPSFSDLPEVREDPVPHRVIRAVLGEQAVDDRMRLGSVELAEGSGEFVP